MVTPCIHSPSPARRSTLRLLGSLLVRAACMLALGGMATCDGVDNFEVEVGGNGVVPAGTIIDEVLGTLDVDALQSIDLSQELENQGVTKEDVDSVRMIRFTLRIEGPPGATFDFLESVAFYAETEGQPRVLVAEIQEVPAGATELELEVIPDVELKPYVVAPQMRISGEVEGSRPGEETTVAAEVVLDVDVTVPGC